MSKAWEKFFFLLTWACQGSSYLSPRAYAILHRLHHAYSDTPKDPHSPHHTDNVFTMMWETKKIFSELQYQEAEAKIEERFKRNIPGWPALDHFASLLPVRVLWGVLYVAFYVLCISVLELPYTHWAMYALLPVHFLMGPVHGAIVNWSGHMYGYANFDNNDRSKNSLLFDFLMLGELFQNNHHKLPNRANFAVRWFEFDPVYPAIKLLSACRIIKMKKPAQSELEPRQAA